MSDELEIFKGVPLLLKVNLIDRELPLSLVFHYLKPDGVTKSQRAGLKDLVVYYSMEHKRPREGINHGIATNVSSILTYFVKNLYVA